MTGTPDFSRRPARRMKTPIAYQETSREAWERVKAGSLDEKILAELEARGIEGAMCWQIEKAIGGSHQSVSGNLRHLVEDGAAFRLDKKGKTPTGRSAFYWIHGRFARRLTEERDNND